MALHHSYASEDWEYYPPPTPVPIDSCPPIFYEEPKEKPRTNLLSVCVLILLVVCLLAFVAAIGGIIGRFFLNQPSKSTNGDSPQTTVCPCASNKTKPHPESSSQTGGQNENGEKVQKAGTGSHPRKSGGEPGQSGSGAWEDFGGNVWYPTPAPTPPPPIPPFQPATTTQKPPHRATTRRPIPTTTPETTTKPTTTTIATTTARITDADRRRIQESIRESQQRDGFTSKEKKEKGKLSPRHPTSSPLPATPFPPMGLGTAPFSTIVAPTTPTRFVPTEPGLQIEDIQDNTLLYRIPRSRMEPLHYDVTLQIEKMVRIEGVVSVTVRVGRKTKLLGLHAVEMNIKKVYVTDVVSKRDVYGEGGSWGIDQTHQALTIRTGSDLRPRRFYNVTIRYDIPVCDNKAINCDEAGARDSFATKLEPTYARYLYPCVDDPAAKATFTTTVIHQKSANLTVLGNQGLCKRDQRDGWYIDTFCKTPKMTTYNFAVVVGKFVSACNYTSTRVRLCIWLSPRYKTSLNYAMVTAIQAFDHAQNYFKIPYKMSKIDFVGIYGYPSAAMENWGLVVHHASSLAIEIGSKTLIQDIITHEVVHQWFGNLVTMSWWDDIWLNEGFAQFFTYYFRRHDRPLEAKTMYYMYLMHTMDAQSEPGQANALVRNFTSPEGLAKSFTELGFLNIYIKGSYMVTMLKNLMEPKLFRSTITGFLRDYSFKSFDRYELLGYFQKSARVHRSLTDVMIPWLQNRGYPEVHIWRNLTSGDMILYQYPADQSRHCDYQASNEVSVPQIWPIPIIYRSRWVQKDKDSGIYWLSDESQDLAVPRLGPDEWILLNPGFTMMYRINYDELSLDLLTGQLRNDPSVIPPESRAQILQDAGYFYRESTDRIIQYLDLLGYLERETHILPWLIGVSKISEVFTTFKDSNLFPLLQIQFSPAIFKAWEVYHQLFQTKQLHDILTHRANRICWLICAIGHPDCEVHAKAENLTLLNPENRHQDDTDSSCHYIYLTRRVLHYTSDEEFETLLTTMRIPGYFESASNPTAYYVSLLCAPNRFFVHELLQTLSENGEIMHILISILRFTTLSVEPCPYMYAELWSLLQETDRSEFYSAFDIPSHRISKQLGRLIRKTDQAYLAEMILPEQLTYVAVEARARIEWVEKVEMKLSRDLHKRLKTPHWNDRLHF